MDTIEFAGKRDFPFTTDVLNFMQNAYKIFNAYSALASQGSCIISGCTVYGNYVSSGYVLITGNLYFFKGGTKQTYVSLFVKNEEITVAEGVRKQTTGYVDFGLGGVYSILWDTLDKARLKNLHTLTNETKTAIADIEALEVRVNSIDSSIEALGGDINILAQSIQGNTSTIDSINNELGNVDNKISNCNNDIGNINTALDGIKYKHDYTYWNMQVESTKNIGHNIDISTIVSVSVNILKNGGVKEIHPINTSINGNIGGYWKLTDGNIQIVRTANGIFNNSAYADCAVDVVIGYKPNL